MKFVSNDLLERASKGDIAALVKLDDHGLIIGSDESAVEFVERVKTLRKNISELNADLGKEGMVPLHGVTLRRDDAIPAEVFKSAAKETKRLFGFGIDWVPGFFTDERMGLLFAGCAMYSYEDFFAVFLVRKGFQNAAKWFIYQRRELMAHELTHIAHIGFRTPNYEEHFAFQTSDSSFRKRLGGLFRTTRDTYLILGALFALLATQIAGFVFTLLATEEADSLYHSLARFSQVATPFCFLAAFACVGSVVLSYMFSQKTISRAQANVSTTFGESKALPVLFRCSADEICSLAKMQPGEAAGWMAEQRKTSARWGVIYQKFGPKTKSA